MNQENIFVKNDGSTIVDFVGLIVSLVGRGMDYVCEVAIGFPGVPNVYQEMDTADIVLFEVPSIGTIEVRLLSKIGDGAQFLISEITPRSGPSFGVISDDPLNDLFSAHEQERIAESIKEIKESMSTQNLLTQEEFYLISRKLDEILEASKRLGRKDWINYAAGALTGLCISAAFSSEVRKFLLESVNSAFDWLSQNALAWLP